jgi:hypothetical protein
LLLRQINVKIADPNGRYILDKELQYVSQLPLKLDWGYSQQCQTRTPLEAGHFSKLSLYP